MKKSGVTFFLLGLGMLSLAGCAVGPCAGYGCPSLARAVEQAPERPVNTAQTEKATARELEAQFHSGQ
jgi:hypothetical protein